MAHLCHQQPQHWLLRRLRQRPGSLGEHRAWGSPRGSAGQQEAQLGPCDSAAPSTLAVAVVVAAHAGSANTDQTRVSYPTVAHLQEPCWATRPLCTPAMFKNDYCPVSRVNLVLSLSRCSGGSGMRAARLCGICCLSLEIPPQLPL